MNIHYNWQPSAELPEYIGQTCVDMCIKVGDAVITRHTDSRAHDPLEALDSICASAYPLAYWFAENWWRLFYDINTTREEWATAHNLIYAADGYIWPNLSMLCDDNSMVFSSPAANDEEQQGIIQYFPALLVNEGRQSVSDFGQTLKKFIEATINQAGSSNSDLSTTWKAVLEESANEEFSLYRQIEARLGYAPNDASEELVDLHIAAIGDYGKQGVMDLASENLLAQAMQCDFSQRGEWNLLPGGSGLLPRGEADSTQEAWQQGYSLARSVRSSLDIAPGKPIDNQRLGEFFRFTQNALEQQWRRDKSINAGFLRRFEGDSLALHVGGFMRRSSKRFMTTRLLGAQIMAPREESLLVCNGTNARFQQIQRAFAAELLCPQEGMKEKEFFRNIYCPQPHELEKAGEYYGVSPLVIEHQCANAANEQNHAC